MVSLNRDRDFRGQHLLQLGIRLGHLAVPSRVPCARVVCCMNRHEEIDSSIFDPFHLIIVEKCF